jgi:hypothetical protein
VEIALRDEAPVNPGDLEPEPRRFVRKIKNPLFRAGFLFWWRRGELNPGPKAFHREAGYVLSRCF